MDAPAASIGLGRSEGMLSRSDNVSWHSSCECRNFHHRGLLVRSYKTHEAAGNSNIFASKSDSITFSDVISLPITISLFIIKLAFKILWIFVEIIYNVTLVAIGIVFVGTAGLLSVRGHCCW